MVPKLNDLWHRPYSTREVPSRPSESDQPREHLTAPGPRDVRCAIPSVFKVDYCGSDEVGASSYLWNIYLHDLIVDYRLDAYARFMFRRDLRTRVEAAARDRRCAGSGNDRVPAVQGQGPHTDTSRSKGQGMPEVRGSHAAKGMLQ